MLAISRNQLDTDRLHVKRNLVMQRINLVHRTLEIKASGLYGITLHSSHFFDNDVVSTICNLDTQNGVRSKCPVYRLVYHGGKVHVVRTDNIEEGHGYSGF